MSDEQRMGIDLGDGVDRTVLVVHHHDIEERARWYNDGFDDGYDQGIEAGQSDGRLAFVLTVPVAFVLGMLVLRLAQQVLS